jgi:hypothetical protein
MADGLGALHGRVDEGNTLREVPPGSAILAAIEQGLPQHVMGLEEMRRHRLTLSQAVEFFAQFYCHRQGSPATIEPP